MSARHPDGNEKLRLQEKVRKLKVTVTARQCLIVTSAVPCFDGIVATRYNRLSIQVWPRPMPRIVCPNRQCKRLWWAIGELGAAFLCACFMETAYRLSNVQVVCPVSSYSQAFRSHDMGVFMIMGLSFSLAMLLKANVMLLITVL